MSRIVLFGATGYTGRLTAARLANARVDTAVEEIVLAGRHGERLEALRAELEQQRDGSPALVTAVADVADPESVRWLLREPDDVLVSCVGPFQRWGRPAVAAAIEAGATYFDSTGEPEFLRGLFEVYAARAEASGARLVPAFGYDYVPGNLAGALALHAARETGTLATRVAIGYFSPGAPGISGGTAASGPGILLGKSYAFRSGQLDTEYSGQRTHKFTHQDRSSRGISVGGTEHFDLPTCYPDLIDVGVFMGQLGNAALPTHLGAMAAHQVLRLPLVRRTVQATTAVLITGSRGGPESMDGTSLAVAEACDANGTVIATATVRGPSPYDLTARLLAWAATHASLIETPGTMGPVTAFGLPALEAGCAEIGLVRAVG